MKPSEDLFLLIKSMSQNEKGYFKKYCSKFNSEKDAGYTKLFNAIAFQVSKGEYDEDKIKLKYKGEKFVKNFSVSKNYLFDIILSSLRDYGRKKSSSRKYLFAIDKAMILMDRNLFTSAKKILNPARESSLEGEYFMEHIMINDLYAKLISMTSYENHSLKDQMRLYRNSKFAIGKYTNTLGYRHRQNMFYGTLRSPGLTSINNIIKDLHKIYSEVYFKDDSKALSHEAKLAFLNVKGAYHSFINDHNSALVYRKRSVELYEKKIRYLRENLRGYASEIFNYAFELTASGKFGEAMKYCGKLEELEIKFSDYTNAGIKMKIFCRYTILLFISTQMGEFDVITKEIKKIEEGLRTYKNKIDTYSESNICFYVSYSLFGCGEFDKALGWINKIMKKGSVKVSPGLTSVSKILSLMIHYEMGNFDILEYQLQAASRYFKKYNIINQSLMLFQKFFKSLISSGGRSIHKNELLKIGESLRKLKRADMVEDLDIVSWLESKIESKNFKLIVKEKAGNFRLNN